MPVWKPASIEESPAITLLQWKIYEVSSLLWPGRTRHFCGYNVTHREGRVSSAIIEFDQEKMIGKTESGRVYHLRGNSGAIDLDAAYVWDFFKLRNNLTNIKDVSGDYETV